MIQFLLKSDPHSAPRLPSADWSRVRRPEVARDSALTGTARHWLQRLPPRRRPYRLCARYPRVANRIAWLWTDPVMSAQVLQDLLVDRRGGRAGFPSWILRELHRLQEFNQQHRVEDTPETWIDATHRLLDGA